VGRLDLVAFVIHGGPLDLVIRLAVSLNLVGRLVLSPWALDLRIVGHPFLPRETLARLLRAFPY
jgi:hypothetical protein